MPFDPNDPDTKAALKAAVEEAVETAVEEAKSGLEAKNKDLLARLKKAKEGSQIDPAEVERLEGQVEELRTKLTAAEKSAKDATTAAEKAAKALEQESGFTQKLLIQDGLKSELIKNGVKDEDFIDTLTAKFAASAAVVAEGENRKVMLGEKPLADAIKEFAASDSGKKFVSAPNNSGGGAGGGKGDANSKTITRTAFNAMDPAGQMAFSKDGGKVVDQAA